MTIPPPHEPPAADDTAYLRAAGYAEDYRDHRFQRGHGRSTDRRERRALRRLLRCAAWGPGPWLDLPSGAGRLSAELPGPVVQVDADLAMLRAAAPAAVRVQARARELPFADDTFAGALCMRLLQHIPGSRERREILRELARVTDGPIIASFFHSWSVQHLRRALSRRLGRKPRSGRSAVTLRAIHTDAAAAGLAVAGHAPLLPLWSDQWLLLCVRAP